MANKKQDGVEEVITSTTTPALIVTGNASSSGLDASKVVSSIKEPVSATAGTIPVGIFKLSSDASAPEYATPGSMCFDIKACLDVGSVVTGYSKYNEKKAGTVGIYDRETMNRGIPVEPGDRLMIPTGLIFDLPEGTALLLYPRSGLSLKQGIKLGNCVAVIDNDYVEQTYIIVENTSDVRVVIMHGDRICQGEVVFTPPQVTFKTLTTRPTQKTTRAGGLGSTGK